ncbi:MAG: VOC family protein [Alphaproteobacteria bacterium]|jgi:catechol-2,3-dioxygenase|nr:VOC family protein [Alphaproteobacteria bacterium]MDP6566970.1 VOC family protein [Alphaproteobacteria bacterium]MDP6816023.1 VOC family protein [Alphaproteobacteria bacterium]
MSEDRAIPPVRIAHFVLVSNDAARLVDWYKWVFGCEEVHRNDRIAFLTFDDEHHRFAIAQSEAAAPKDGPTVGVHHIAFSYPGLEDLLTTYERLKAGDVRPYWCVDHGMTTSMYYRDPDGNQLEFQVDNFATPEETKGIFRSPEFAANVYGNDYDPEAMLAAWRDGSLVEQFPRSAQALGGHDR